MAGISGQLYVFNEYYGASVGGGQHFYTAFPRRENMNGFSVNISNTWSLFSSSSASARAGSLSPVYRLYRAGAGHFYTISTTQKNNAQNGGYSYEGIVGYAYSSSGSYRIPVYRYYNSSQDNHWYPTNRNGFVNYSFKQTAWYSPIFVYGCGDSTALNYNRYVNQPSTGCTYNVYGCTDSRASNYNPRANVNSGCSYPTPSISFSISPSSIIQGENATLSWSISNSTSRSLTDFGAIGTSGSTDVSPADDRTYTVSASYYGITSNTMAKTLVVYVPPNITLSLASQNINLGESTILSWITTGDASTANIQPGIGSSNLVSQVSVSPTVTTTYTATVSGAGGVDSDEITLTVFPPPEVNLDGPISVTYGESVTLTHEQERAIDTYELQIAMTDLDDNIITDLVDLGAAASGSGTYIHNVPYNNRGPSSIIYTLFAVGPGGLSDSESVTVNVDIDQMPFNIQIPESDDKIKSEAPIISPDAEVTSEQILIDDIDIPVAIKADAPIQVEIDNSNTFVDVEQI